MDSIIPILVHGLCCPHRTNRDVYMPSTPPVTLSSQALLISECSPAGWAACGDLHLPGPPTENEAAVRNEVHFLAFSRFRLELIRVTTAWIAAKEKGYWYASKK